MDAYVAAADASSSSNSVLVATCSKALISFTLDHAHTLYTCTGDAVLSESELLLTTQDDIRHIPFIWSIWCDGQGQKNCESVPLSTSNLMELENHEHILTCQTENMVMQFKR